MSSTTFSTHTITFITGVAIWFRLGVTISANGNITIVTTTSFPLTTLVRTQAWNVARFDWLFDLFSSNDFRDLDSFKLFGWLVRW